MASWLNNAIFYEIYPQSFNDSNGDGIGDFQGIIDKLQYVRDLGCNAIWINPCFDSSFYDAGYDVRDYYITAERYGSNADLQRLFERAHELGMHVLLDLVPGHSAVDNPWFLESGKDERNAWTDRYIWRPMTQSPNLNSPYESIRGFLGGIAERPDAAAVNCFSTQACLNYGFGTVTEDWQFAADSPEAVQGRLLIQDIMDFWLGLGADGFRVDMAGSLVKEDPDHYWTKLLWQQVRAHLDETYPEAVLVSEWGDPEEALHAGFDMDFLLHFGPSHILTCSARIRIFRPDLPKLRAAPKLPKRNTTANTANAMARAAAGATATAIQSSTETIQIAITTMSAMRAATSRRLWTHIRPCLPAPPERLDTSAFRRAITT